MKSLRLCLLGEAM